MSENKRVLITGGANGIGAAVNELCAEQGYETIVIDKDGDTSIRCDLTDPESTLHAVSIALRKGDITRIVNNVGGLLPANVLDETVESFDWTIALNLRSAFVCTQALVPSMKRNRFGRIVSISSRAALGKELRTSYSAAKAGLQGMTRTWALELGNVGITANTVSPGPIETELFTEANTFESPETQQIMRSIPVQRMGIPEDVSHAVNFLLHEKSSFITGQNINVCGGLTVGASYV